VTKDIYRKAEKYKNRTGLDMAIDDPELNYDPPTHLRRRWGWAIPWDMGICYGRGPYAWNKHLYRPSGVCRRCGWHRERKRRVEWNPDLKTYTLIGGEI
jgi:hypothetical protein